jgi:hypothetical protein
VFLTELLDGAGKLLLLGGEHTNAPSCRLVSA